MTETRVILVNEKGIEIGSMEKLKAHEEGLLHRAFSVVLFDENKRILLQKRSLKKYHSGGLWSNTCCSHPEPGQSLPIAVEKALIREMGIKCDTREVGSFIYKEKLENGFIEYEYDYVFAGNFYGNPNPSSDEVSEWKYMEINEIIKDLKVNRKNYTVWLAKVLEIAGKFI